MGGNSGGGTGEGGLDGSLSSSSSLLACKASSTSMLSNVGKYSISERGDWIGSRGGKFCEEGDAGAKEGDKSDAAGDSIVACVVGDEVRDVGVGEVFVGEVKTENRPPRTSKVDESSWLLRFFRWLRLFLRQDEGDGGRVFEGGGGNEEGI